jgi:hypothetical protein
MLFVTAFIVLAASGPVLSAPVPSPQGIALRDAAGAVVGARDDTLSTNSLHRRGKKRPKKTPKTPKAKPTKTPKAKPTKTPKATPTKTSETVVDPSLDSIAAVPPPQGTGRSNGLSNGLSNVSFWETKSQTPCLTAVPSAFGAKRSDCHSADHSSNWDSLHRRHYPAHRRDRAPRGWRRPASRGDRSCY